MKREFLKEIGLNDEAIDKVMAEYGRGVNAAKEEAEKTAAELEQVKSDLKKAQETLESFKDYDEVKNEVAKYKADFENSKRDYEKKIATMELNNRVKDFTNTKKFVNELTKDAINTKLAAALEADENKGKSMEELFNDITNGVENILVEENKATPPKILDNMQGDKHEESGLEAAFRKLNPHIKNI